MNLLEARYLPQPLVSEPEQQVLFHNSGFFDEPSDAPFVEFDTNVELDDETTAELMTMIGNAGGDEETG